MEGDELTATETIDFTCPKCKEKSRVTIYKSINATQDPDARKALLEGKINQFVCSKCDQKGYLLVSFLYHDMDRRFLVQYHPFPAVQSEDFLKDFDAAGRPRLQSEKLATEIDRKLKYFSEMHVVFDMAEMMRYIVFRERLHDVLAARGGKKK
jgi:hypothetical protein